MKTIDKTRSRGATLSLALARLIAVLAITCALYSQALAQQTPADTQIKNTASATYSDGSQSYATTSNTVTVTVSKVSGLTILPDVTNGSSDPTVVPGQANVSFTFYNFVSSGLCCRPSSASNNRPPFRFRNVVCARRK